MKNFNSIGFANIFGRIHAASNPGFIRRRWEIGGVEWLQDRYGHAGPYYSFQCEAHLLKRDAAKNPWIFLYVTESWWSAAGKDALRNHSWGKIIRGRKTDVVAWIKTQESRLQDNRTRERA